MRNGFKVIDADGHFYEPGDIWDNYVEPAFQEHRPRVVQVHGKAILEYEGEETMNALKSKQLFSMMDDKFGHAFPGQLESGEPHQGHGHRRVGHSGLFAYERSRRAFL